MSPKPDILRLPLTTRYSLAAAAHLATQPHGAYCLVGRVAASTGMPRSFLATILQRMARKGLLDSCRGPLGGYRLRTQPTRITLADVVEAGGDGSHDRGQCLAAARKCDPDRPCVLHPVVRACQDDLWDMLNRTKLSELAATEER
ncbi:MAG: Rrf2 family transcriptional regulator [Elusimicrobia bacterium]|nr:Rrf2 family transcriptional regulator [Elusimicrobiota bacterium]